MKSAVYFDRTFFTTNIISRICDIHHIFYVFLLYFILRGYITSTNDKRGKSSYLWSTKIYLCL